MQIAEIDFCSPLDLEAIYAIECAAFDPPWEKEVIAADLANLGSVIYLKATLCAALVGYCALSRVNTVAHLLNLVVAEPFRRQGIASQLFLAAEEVAREWACSKIRLEVRVSNRVARDFYARIGFSYNTRLHDYYPNGEDALVLVASLPLSIIRK